MNYFKRQWYGWLHDTNVKVVDEPTLVADFVNKTYTSNGVNTSFDDAFTFKRDSKAWLLTDDGLNEYAPNTPRFNEGLLIEQESTNMIANSLGGSGDTDWTNTYTVVDGGISPLTNTQIKANFKDSTDFKTLRPPKTHTFVDGNEYSFRLITNVVGNMSVLGYVGVLGANASVYIDNNGNDVTSPNTVINHNERISNDFIDISFTTTSTRTVTNRGFQFICSDIDESFTLAHVQYELGSHSSSIIPTSTTPVTRSEDVLINKITGDKVTGDWDNTLVITINNGKLLYSGYGYIRTLTIT